MEEVVDFLRKNVNGKTLYTDEMTFFLENEKLQTTYSNQISFSNLFFSKTRLAMDMFIVSKEKMIEVDTGTAIKDVYSSSLFRYNLAKRQSTEEVTGI